MFGLVIPRTTAIVFVAFLFVCLPLSGTSCSYEYRSEILIESGVSSEIHDVNIPILLSSLWLQSEGLLDSCDLVGFSLDVDADPSSSSSAWLEYWLEAACFVENTTFVVNLPTLPAAPGTVLLYLFHNCIGGGVPPSAASVLTSDPDWFLARSVRMTKTNPVASSICTFQYRSSLSLRMSSVPMEDQLNVGVRVSVDAFEFVSNNWLDSGCTQVGFTFDPVPTADTVWFDFWRESSCAVSSSVRTRFVVQIPNFPILFERLDYRLFMFHKCVSGTGDRPLLLSLPWNNGFGEFVIMKSTSGPCFDGYANRDDLTDGRLLRVAGGGAGEGGSKSDSKLTDAGRLHLHSPPLPPVFLGTDPDSMPCNLTTFLDPSATDVSGETHSHSVGSSLAVDTPMSHLLSFCASQELDVTPLQDAVLLFAESDVTLPEGLSSFAALDDRYVVGAGPAMGNAGTTTGDLEHNHDPFYEADEIDYGDMAVATAGGGCRLSYPGHNHGIVEVAGSVAPNTPLFVTVRFVSVSDPSVVRLESPIVLMLSSSALPPLGWKTHELSTNASWFGRFLFGSPTTYGETGGSLNHSHTFDFGTQAGFSVNAYCGTDSCTGFGHSHWGASYVSVPRESSLPFVSGFFAVREVELFHFDEPETSPMSLANLECFSSSAFDVLSVCGGHGICVDVDICLCDIHPVSKVPLYAGLSCSHPICSNRSLGYGDTESMICGGHECLSPNNCAKPRVGASDVALIVLSSVFGAGGLVAIFVVIVIVIVVATSASLRAKKRKDLAAEISRIEEIELKDFVDDDGCVKKLSVRPHVFQIPFEDISIPKDGTLLGTGGSGTTVRKATWNGKSIALKLFHLQANTTQKQMDSFMDEAGLMAELRHPHIILYFGCCLHLPYVGICMELCKCSVKECVRDYRADHGTGMPVQKKIKILVETASGVGHLHSREIIHRVRHRDFYDVDSFFQDLKPENVLYDQNDDCKVMDFGLARQICASQNDTRTCGIGTSCYMAPEIISGSSYDSKVDVYSFAIFAYVLLSENFSPFGMEEFVDYRVSSDASFRPNLGEIRGLDWCKTLIVSCWDHDPGERPSFESIHRLLSGRYTSSGKIIYVRHSFQLDEEAEDLCLKEMTLGELKRYGVAQWGSDRMGELTGIVFVSEEDGVESPLLFDDSVASLKDDAVVVFQFARPPSEVGVEGVTQVVDDDGKENGD